jgi:hypothetical protein
MAKGKKKRNLLKATVTTNIAARASATIGSSVKGRDSLTRVKSPIKVVDTHARQWNRWSP